MPTVRVSVIIPVFNAEQYIENCLRSITSQTEKNIEVICVDDGSTDRSVEVIESLRKTDNRITVIEQNNLGAGAARNIGMKHARGQYLAFLDADDYFETEMLSLAANELDQFEADIAIFATDMFDSETGEIEGMPWTFIRGNIPDKQPFCAKDMPDYIFNTFGNYPWNKLFRREFVEKNSLSFQEIPRTNDLLFVCCALVKASRIVAIDKVLAHYRIGTGTSLQSTNSNSPLSFIEAFIALKAALKESGEFPNFELSYLKHALNGMFANIESQKLPNGLSILKSSILEAESALEILEKPIEYYDAPEEYRQYERFVTRPENEYLFYRLIREKSITKDLQTCIGNLAKELENTQRAKASLEKNLDETITSLEEVRKGKSISDAEIECLCNSFSFKIGRAVTFLPRKIRSIFTR